MKRTVILLVTLLFLAWGAAYECNAQPDKGMSWPEGQVLPHFASLPDQLDGLTVSGRNYAPSEKAMFGVLQGLVNKTKPRLYLYDAPGEGKDKWPTLLKVNIKEWPRERRWELVGKYRNEISGAVLYSTERSEHYINLASTVAGIKNALPVTASEMDSLKKAGVNLPVVADLTALQYTTPEDIYKYMYATYWKDCNHRLLITLGPRFGANIRDLAVASVSAIVWLDPRRPEQQAALRPFLADMTPGESILTGWWAEERSGIGIATEYGLSTIPADFYENPTVWAAMPHTINLPVTPKKPQLENKIYLAVFLSDGDNVQYCQHAMSRLWDNKGRGTFPINWTVSPGLVDYGPGLLNYYYATSTPNDFLASGPSGLGYSLIYDAHNRKWFASDRKTIEPYTKLTQKYLEKSGLRVITIWDEVNYEQMEAYADNCRYLYGVTVEDWERHTPIPNYELRNKLAFIPNHPCYTGDINVMVDRWSKKIAKFDGTQPLFLSAQGESWKMGPDSLIALQAKLEKLAPGKIVFCRGDHFFALYNEANGMPFNLCMSPALKVSSSPASTPAAMAADGSCAKNLQWVSNSAKGWVSFDFGREYMIDRYVVRHAETGGADPSFNTKDYTIEFSADGRKWKKSVTYAGNKDAVNDADIAPVKARYARITVTSPGAGGKALLADVEFYGKINEEVGGR